MKRVLIITYYWPPSGGGGVMRWLKMSKYLPEFGWQPIIYTPENPDPSVVDDSLISEIHPLTEVLRYPIWEPYDLYRKLTGKKKSDTFKAGYVSEASHGNWKDRISVFLRGNLLIPDPRVFWIRPSIKYLRKYLMKHPVDLIVTTGPPHSMHLIGLGLKKHSGVPWLADFRDPWTEIDFYHKLKLTRLADFIHHRLERKVLQEASVVTTVSPYLKKTTEKISGRKVEVIFNGFDPSDFTFSDETLDLEFSITHFGSFNRDRNPRFLWKVLGAWCKKDPVFAKNLKIRLIGQTDGSIISDIIMEGLTNQLELLENMPHMEGLQKLAKSQILLLPLNDAPNVKGILPGKMYEYIALRRPILAIGPTDGDIAMILKDTQAGDICHFTDDIGLAASLNRFYTAYLAGKLIANPLNYEKYSRRNLASQIISLPFHSA